MMPRDEYFQEGSTSKVCPFLRAPCIKERCMAWHGSEDLARLKAEKPETYQKLVAAIGMTEMVSDAEAEKIIHLRNGDERCRLIRPEPVI